MNRPQLHRILNNGNVIGDYRLTRNWTPPKHRFQGEFGMSVRYSNDHCFTLGAVKWTENTTSQENILAAKHLQRWKERNDPLWWSCLAHVDIGKRIVRSNQSRRLRQAFVESLRKKGYAADGSPLPDTRRPALVGTAMLGAKVPMVKLKMEDLILRTDMIADKILQSQPWFVRNNHKADGRRFSTGRQPGRERELADRPFTLKIRRQ